MSDSSYSSVAPKPLHWLQAPRGLLKEKSAGVTVAAGRVAGAAGGEAGEPEPAAARRTRRDEHDRHAFALLERGRDRLGQPARRRRLGDQPVDHDQQLAARG